jgi:hypothetical protein
MNAITWNTTAVDKFLKLTKTARDYNSKELRLSIEDAQALSMSLAMILNQERELIQKILILQDRLLSMNESAPTNIDMNGGTF